MTVESKRQQHENKDIFIGCVTGIIGVYTEHTRQTNIHTDYNSHGVQTLALLVFGQLMSTHLKKNYITSLKYFKSSETIMRVEYGVIHIFVIYPNRCLVSFGHVHHETRTGPAAISLRVQIKMVIHSIQMTFGVAERICTICMEDIIVDLEVIGHGYILC